jgi:hypothetical protein
MLFDSHIEAYERIENQFGENMGERFAQIMVYREMLIFADHNHGGDQDLWSTGNVVMLQEFCGTRSEIESSQQGHKPESEFSVSRRVKHSSV